MNMGSIAVDACLAGLGFESRSVETQRGRVRVITGAGGGELPTMVLLHGLGSQGADYLPLLLRLRPHVRKLVAPDLPGHGASDATFAERPRRTHIETLTEALDAVLDEPAIVFGNSLGGFAAIRYALARPDRVRALYLASPSGAPSTADEIESLLGALRVESHDDALRFIARAMPGNKSLFRHVMAWGVRRRFAAVRPWIESIRDPNPFTAAELARLSVPVHLVWGREEQLLPAAHLEFFRAHLPRTARIEEPEGFAHSPQVDDAKDVARRLLAFARAS